MKFKKNIENIFFSYLGYFRNNNKTIPNLRVLKKNYRLPAILPNFFL